MTPSMMSSMTCSTNADIVCGRDARVAWIAAEAEALPDVSPSTGLHRNDSHSHALQPNSSQLNATHPSAGENVVAIRPVWVRPDPGDEEYERRTYRGRTVAMLRRYMRYAMETGRLPSLLGREFFRAKVTSYTVVTFEDRVIFVHDMETCLDRLDEFSRELIARHVLQEHDRHATARLLQCNEKTVRRLTPLALDQLSEILLDMGLLERLDNDRLDNERLDRERIDTERVETAARISCQVGASAKTSAND